MSKEKPYISVVIPARNEEENIERLLESVEEQDYDDYEVVVVDGGSSDRTREVAENYGARVIEGPQEGTAVARNIGWKNARGEVIFFMDADWFFDDGNLKAVAKEFENGADFVGVNNRHYTESWVSKAVSAENRFGSNSMRNEKIMAYLKKFRELLKW